MLAFELSTAIERRCGVLPLPGDQAGRKAERHIGDDVVDRIPVSSHTKSRRLTDDVESHFGTEQCFRLQPAVCERQCVASAEGTVELVECRRAAAAIERATAS